MVKNSMNSTTPLHCHIQNLLKVIWM